MVITAIVVGGLGYVVYREYKSGKLATEVKTLEAKVTPFLTAAKADVTKVVAAVVADVKKL